MGARVGDIRFESPQLFDADGGDQDASLFRLANRPHIRTREATLTDQLLFKSGDLYQAR